MAISEKQQKPYVGLLGLQTDEDDSVVQFWAALLNTDSGQEALWGSSTGCNINTCQHSNIVRQWAELAYWFPARSHALGSNAFSLLPALSNVDFTPYSPPSAALFTITNTSTHSYLATNPYSTEYQAWKTLAALLK